MRQFLQYQDEDLYLHHTYSDLSSDRGTMKMHAHSDYEIFYFVSGDCSYIVEGTRYPLVPGSLMLMRPAEVHCLKTGSDPLYERVVLNFSQRLVDHIDPAGMLLQPFLNRPLGQLNLYDPADFSASVSRLILQMVSTERAMDQYQRKVAIQANLYQLLYEIRESFMNRIEQAHDTPGAFPDNELIGYINQNITGELSLETLSAHFFISKSQLGRRFKQLTGTTIGSYIAAKRLIAAREQLLAGQTAAEVSQNCGFHDYSVFYRAYRKKYGVSPVRQR